MHIDDRKHHTENKTKKKEKKNIHYKRMKYVNEFLSVWAYAYESDEKVDKINKHVGLREKNNRLILMQICIYILRLIHSNPEGFFSRRLFFFIGFKSPIAR